MRAALIVLGLSLSACASTSSNVYADQQEPQLPNSTMQTAQPLVPGEETTGALACGQVAWYRIACPDGRAMTMRIFGQAQENALGATATLTVVAPNGQAMGQLMIPVFARAPNWDPREQTFQPPAPGTFFARVQLDPNGCQRVGYRLSISGG